MKWKPKNGARPANAGAYSLSKNNLYNFISEGRWYGSIHHENPSSVLGFFELLIELVQLIFGQALSDFSYCLKVSIGI